MKKYNFPYSDIVSITSDSPSYLKVSDISEELRLFSKVIEEKYTEIDFEFAFCFRALYTGEGIKSKVRFYKDENWLGFDIIMPEKKFKPYKYNVCMQRLIMGQYFFPFFVEKIKNYKNKLPSLKLVMDSLIKDMNLFLIENLWLPTESGDLKISIIETITYERAISLFGNPLKKEFTDNDLGQKKQNLTWEINTKTKLNAEYELIEKKWILLNFKLDEE